MSFINSPQEQLKHPNAFIIASGGILFEVDEFKEGTELRNHFSKGIIKEIAEVYFIVQWDIYSIKYPLPYKFIEYGHLGLTQDDMYLYDFEERPLDVEINKKSKHPKNEQMNLFDLVILN